MSTGRGLAVARGFGLIVLIAFVAYAAYVVLDRPPPYRTELTQGSWSVIGIDGQILPGEPAARLIFGSDSVEFITDCQRARGFAIRDSDGAGMVMGGFVTSHSDCRPDEAKRQGTLMETLHETQSWSVEAEDLVLLHGLQHVVTLARVPVSPPASVRKQTAQFSVVWVADRA